MTSSPHTPVERARVLRDAAWQSKPRVLGRAGATGTEVSAQVVQLVSLPGGATPAQDAPLAKAAALGEQEHVLRTAHDAGFQEGFASATGADRRAGYDAGYTEGSEQARRAALLAEEQRANAIQAEAAGRAEHLDSLFDAFELQLGERLKTRMLEAEDDVVALSHAAICRILGEQAANGVATRAIVRNAIDEWLALHQDQTGPITVHVHPRDLVFLKEESPWHGQLQIDQARRVAWQPDPQIELGGCVVVGEHGRLDARLDTQLTALRALMLREVQAAGRSPQGPAT